MEGSVFTFLRGTILWGRIQEDNGDKLALFPTACVPTWVIAPWISYQAAPGIIAPWILTVSDVLLNPAASTICSQLLLAPPFVVSSVYSLRQGVSPRSVVTLAFRSGRYVDLRLPCSDTS